MALMLLPALGGVAVTGGTHGNELSGVYLVQEMERQRREKGDSAWPIPVTTVLSNPRAVKECRRYIDTDMNRCFNSATLSCGFCNHPLHYMTDREERLDLKISKLEILQKQRHPHLGCSWESSPYEVRRAQELNNILGSKGSVDAIDMICDLHNTTSNMGLTLIHYTSSDWVTLHICRYLQTKITKVPVRVLVLDFSVSEAYNLESVSKHGFTMEIGPQPQGVVRADIFIVMKEAVELTIDWIHKFNSGTVFEGGDMEVFKFIKSVDYPRDPETRNLTAAIHPQLQDRDFSLLKKGDPLFLAFSGETLNYEDEESSFHPFFINEAAYYEKGIAFHLAKKLTVTVPTVQVQKD